uniref:Uncharacterized protein n=2 Tax=Candidatus Kentrum sp. TC TaxID=2126339 RepID=A0A450Z0V4_9GAMM|nr:MAG: hypothetical protein BECKTC1821D_GA0114238_10471 [Candidatus Kentron sp. TC]
MWARGLRVWVGGGQHGCCPRAIHTSRRAKDGGRDLSSARLRSPIVEHDASSGQVFGESFPMYRGLIISTEGRDLVRPMSLPISLATIGATDLLASCKIRQFNAVDSALGYEPLTIHSPREVIEGSSD